MVIPFLMPTDPLLDRIEMVLDLYGVSQTAFGYEACRDPTIVAKMRGGGPKNLAPRFIKKPALREKIEAVLSRIERDGGLA